MVSLNYSMSSRARSSVPQFRVRVPAKVVAKLRGKALLLSLGNERPFIKTVRIGSDVSFSLETDDRLIAESRQANAFHLRRLFELTEAEGSDDGPLFAKGQLQARVVDFVRAVVTNPRVAPNHAWRHRLKTISRDLGLDHRIIDAIQGHAPRTAGEDYGDTTVRAMALVIAAIRQIDPADPASKKDRTAVLAKASAGGAISSRHAGNDRQCR